ncbi:MAG: hypothetical protein ABEJ26_03420 [Halosimplex sp.]
MARDVRIRIDDDEVFERMKARKRELDLSWEEVLHRGLREEPPGPPAPEFGPGQDGRREVGPDETSGEAYVGHQFDDSIGAMVEDIKGQVQNQVRESLRASMESVEAAGADLEREMDELANAEDAVLGFADAAGDDSRYEVPLRVRLETSRGGMDVTVVAVREGKSTAGMNRFDAEARRAVNGHLARGGTAQLAFADGAEAYEVAPVLEWGHGDDGNPTVTAVEVDEVIFDG